MPKIDFSKYDGNITLAINRRKGIWASSLLLKNSPTTRQAGNVGSTDVSTDNLYSIALANTLRGIGSKQRESIVRNSKDKVFRKVRLLVTLENTPAAQQFVDGMQRAKESRVAANFRRDLNSQTSKYDLTYEAEPDGGYFVATLERWGENTVSPLAFLPKIMQRHAYQQTYQR